MAIKTVLFYWSKGSEIRREIIKFTDDCSKKEKPCFLNLIAKKLGVSHVAAKKHVDLLIEENYLKPVNPNGKPVFLELTSAGSKMAKELN